MLSTFRTFATTTLTQNARTSYEKEEFYQRPDRSMDCFDRTCMRSVEPPYFAEYAGAERQCPRCRFLMSFRDLADALFPDRWTLS